MHLQACMPCMFVYSMHACMCTCIYKHSCMYVYMHLQTCMHVCIHTVGGNIHLLGNGITAIHPVTCTPPSISLSSSMGRISTVAATGGRLGTVAATGGRLGTVAATGGRLGTVAATGGRLGTVAATGGRQICPGLPPEYYHKPVTNYKKSFFQVFYGFLNVFLGILFHCLSLSLINSCEHKHETTWSNLKVIAEIWDFQSQYLGLKLCHSIWEVLY
jgi:hypothetical protein